MSTERETPNARPDRPGGREGTRLLGVLTVMLLASWLLSMSPLPYSLLSGVTALVALVLLVPVIVQAFRRGRRALAVIAALIGVPATLMIMMGAVVSLLFYGPMSELQECRGEAITERARAQCDEQVQDSVATWFSSVTGG